MGRHCEGFNKGIQQVGVYARQSRDIFDLSCESRPSQGLSGRSATRRSASHGQLDELCVEGRQSRSVGRRQLCVGREQLTILPRGQAESGARFRREERADQCTPAHTYVYSRDQPTVPCANTFMAEPRWIDGGEIIRIDARAQPDDLLARPGPSTECALIGLLYTSVPDKSQSIYRVVEREETGADLVRER